MQRTGDELKKIVFSVVSLAAAAFLLVFSGEVRTAVSDAVSDCLEIIIPSLFAFSALSIYLQKSGLYKIALKPFTFLLSKILRLDEDICGIFLLSNIGGYPVGASLISAMTGEGKLDKSGAERLMCCCFGSGPSFIIGMVGKIVFNSTLAGTIIFVSCFLSSLVIAAKVGAGSRITLQKTALKYDLSAGCFINSVSAAARAMFSVCTMVVIFSVISAALRIIGVNSLLERVFGDSAVFSAVLEVTRIKEIPSGAYAVPICAALLSFGGVCVALQITDIVKGRFSLGKFMLSRIPAAALSAAFSAILSFFIPNISEETLAGNASAQVFSENAVLSVCLLAMSALLLLGEKRRV